MICFGLGFLLLRTLSNNKESGPQKHKTIVVDDESHAALKKTMEADLSASQAGKAVTAWRQAKDNAQAHVDVLMLALQAFEKAEPNNLVSEIVGAMNSHKALSSQKVATQLLDTLACEGQVQHMEQLYQAFQVQHMEQLYQ